MRRIVIHLDDELDTLLATYPNQNETVRQALRLYIGDITPETIEGFRASYAVVAKALREIDSKVNFIANKVQ